MNITEQYNKLAFVAPVIVELCDDLEQTTVCQRELKFHIKRANIEAQKVLKKHFELYRNGTIESLDGHKEMNTEDIYNITSKSYDFLLSKSPNEICVIAKIVQDLEEKGLDYMAIEIPYKPVV